MSEAQAINFGAAGTPRAEPRVRAMVRARMTDNAGQRDVCLVDISTRGLLATTAQPPTRGEIVEIKVGNSSIVGQVRWASDRRFGLALRERVSVAAVAEGGNGNISLTVSRARMAKKRGTAAMFRQNPQLIGRLAQYVIMLIAAASAAYLIYQLTQMGLAPVQDAVGTMNGNGNGNGNGRA